MSNNTKIRRFAIRPALAQPIAPVKSLFDPTMKARMFPLMKITKYLPAVECHNAKEIRPARTKPSSIVQHDSILFIIGAIHRTLPTAHADLFILRQHLQKSVNGPNRIVD